MVETITPVVYGGRRRWLGGLALHVAGATIAAAVFGAVVGWAGAALGAPFGMQGALVLAVVATGYALATAGVLSIPAPQLRRQVPDWWRTYFSPPVAALLYGAGLGVGFLTFLSSGALAVVTLAVALSGDPAAGMVLLGAFGFARGLTAAAGGAVRAPEDAAGLIDRLASRSDVVRRAGAAATMVAVALAAGLAALGLPTGTSGSLAAAVLAVVFGWAAVAKLVGRRRWRRVLDGYDLPPGVRRAAEFGVPAVEALVPVLVVAGSQRTAGLLSFTIVSSFAIASIRAARASGGSVACGCFGGRRETPLRTLLVRDAVLGAIAVAAWALGVDGWRGPGLPATADLVPAALSFVGAALAIAAVLATTNLLRRERA